MSPSFFCFHVEIELHVSLFCLGQETWICNGKILYIERLPVTQTQYSEDNLQTFPSLARFSVVESNWYIKVTGCFLRDNVNTFHFNVFDLILLVLLQVARFFNVCCKYFKNNQDKQSLFIEFEIDATSFN